MLVSAMKQRSMIIAAVLLLPAMLFLVSGCDEIKPAAEGPSISPSSGTINKGQSITFTASDGFEYSWSIGNRDIGILSNDKGQTTTYTSLTDPASETVQTLTLRSRIIGSQGTNGTAYSTSAEAYIRHVGVSITPSGTVSLPVGQPVTFRVSNGMNYTWRLQFPTWGRLTTTSGQETTYVTSSSAPSTGTQVITVRSFESEASVNITHQSPL